MSTPNNTPPYTPMPSLGHELGVMFGFIVACLLIMAVYIYFWRGMAINPTHQPHIPYSILHTPRASLKSEGNLANSNINEAADRRDKQRDKDRQRELAQRAFRYERFPGVGGPREKMRREIGALGGAGGTEMR
ncbi:hypothetical protein ALT_3484 [Aspergillus lentulus]|uniref:Uncharacterized protein n=1 Tax=Aspergillus lentulus TaxID=293939 RepID=A0AAN4PH18_ASPLE|nr:uncharacterized protein IFM58399_08155 [Aspergillus lentulus]KAF4153510.1 hypothetical protein CNMCM6069_000654 [Aspergillus lentulus]KAF4163777.1 hypothetical protein CNMCM6936_000309 [Aspergillus lentulus]KAF4182253.1 hypothetical protein CNMCM7927_000156 [Aspergillus lentulus]KAF4193883.1 hypothetical protein CNMCM8694_008302 [Aspergillus lentulus]KAF4203817.1 hypothetical protein CNMCM8927_008296 [Aspergillus lentulus]